MTANPLPGFDAFEAACKQRGFTWRPFAPVAGAGDLDWTPLGAAADADLAALQARCDGGRFWEIDLAPRARLLEHNPMLRRGSGTLPIAHQLVVFASWHGLAWHLATVPALADTGGRQPVVWLDLYDDGAVTPIASSVDRCFSLLAEHVERFAPSPGGDSEPAFAGSVAGSIATDTRLLELSGAVPMIDLLAHGTGPEPWFAELLAAARR